MSNQNEAVLRLCDDLVESGIDYAHIAEITVIYADALKRRTSDLWKAFYDAVFQALWALVDRPHVLSQREARESLLRILEDDLGCTLFGNGASDLRNQLSLRYERVSAAAG
jgi:hypothetical protein